MDNNYKYLKVFLRRITSNTKLKRSHVSLSIALCQAWIDNEFQSPFKISRSEIMSNAKIRSNTTYHKAIYDLEKQGHIKYYPTYNPVEGSSVAIVMI